MPPNPASGTERPAAVVLAAALFSLLLFGIAEQWPHFAWIARPLVWLATLFHELGHGLAAIVLGGELQQLALYADGSGVAAHAGAYSRLDRALIAAAGPLGAPLAGLVMFFSLGHPQAARGLLGALSFVLLLALLLWVRNGFALLFVAVVAAGLGAIALRAGPRLLYAVSAFIAVEMSLSAFARMGYLFSSGATTGAGSMASDTAQIAAALGLTYWIWGGLLALVSIAIVVMGFWLALRLQRQPHEQSAPV